MKTSHFFTAAAGIIGMSLLTGCVAVAPKDPNPIAYRPNNPAAVKVKVSLSKQQVYVMEGERPLLVAATCVGTPAKPTPKGTFTVYKKIAEKRSFSYGFYKKGDVIKPAPVGKGTGTYIGYPMPYWVEFAPAYGFHQGYVWPMPRSHGCLRLHKNVAPKFFELVRIGTPIVIADSLPEDATIGKNVPRPNDFRDPDPAPEIMISSRAFPKPVGPLLQ